ncbi:hypothetical protein ACFVQ4_31290 [Streptomyces laurentii]|uniref:hypothetical protein n=1 Tax=Streptomyces laurentii TaxID=39478 RepID=UPI0036863F72
MHEPGLQGRHPAPSAQGEVHGGAATEFRIVLQGPYGRLPAHQEPVEEVAVHQGRPGRREVRVAGESRPQRAQFQDRPVQVHVVDAFGRHGGDDDSLVPSTGRTDGHTAPGTDHPQAIDAGHGSW